MPLNRLMVVGRWARALSRSICFNVIGRRYGFRRLRNLSMLRLRCMPSTSKITAWSRFDSADSRFHIGAHQGAITCGVGGQLAGGLGCFGMFRHIRLVCGVVSCP
jgi:hypothetical protein